jgi:thiol-disulfide isomerase/thioredoxin
MVRFKLYSITAVIAILTFSSCNRQKSAENKTITNAIVGLEIGDQAPDLAFQSPDGKTITLSSLRGSIVLVDFWASWCLPCRMENPNLVKLYRQYKNKDFKEGKGFTIYSVSLDTKQKNWLDAIKQDDLDWENHVSDLKGWYSVPAAMYQISSIPANFLLNREGIILDKNLRAEALESRIKSLVH